MTVNVYSGGCLVESKYFKSEPAAIKFASYWQDNGYRVRFQENVKNG